MSTVVKPVHSLSEGFLRLIQNSSLRLKSFKEMTPKSHLFMNQTTLITLYYLFMYVTSKDNGRKMLSIYWSKVWDQ